jgi:hypothetical protein
MKAADMRSYFIKLGNASYTRSPSYSRRIEKHGKSRREHPEKETCNHHF